MKLVIYSILNQHGRADFETAIYDRQVEDDIAKCRAHPEWGCGDTGWHDYEPCAVVEVPGVVYRDGLLCWGARAMCAREVLMAGNDPDVTVLMLGDGAAARLAG